MTVGNAKPKENAMAASSRPDESGQGGFTLIEMMIVVAIVAVLAAIAIPSFSDFMAKSRAKNAAETIYGFLNQAKSEAILRDQDVYIDFVGGADWCIGFIPVPAAAPATTCDCSASPATCVANVGATPVTQVISAADFPQVTLASNFGGGDTVISRLRGTADSAGTLDITSNGWGLQTVVSTMGRIRNCKPTGQAYKSVTGYEVCN